MEKMSTSSVMASTVVEATNAINDIMDDKTAAATQRWQRLMIQALGVFLGVTE